MHRLHLISEIKKAGQSCKEYNGEKFYVATGDVEGDQIVGGEYVTYKNKPSRANVCCKAGDVLFAKMQNTIKVIEVTESNKDYIYSTGFYVFSDDRIDSKFLKYFFESRYFNLLKDSKCQGATMKAINDERISEISVPLYEKTKQIEIVNEIEQIVCMIEKHKMDLIKYDELIKSRFNEMFKDIPRNQYKKFSDICLKITDGTHQPPKFTQKGIPFIFVSNLIENKLTYETQKYISEETYKDLIKRTPIEIGDILLSTVGSYGHPAIVKENKPFCFQRHIAYLKPNNNMINSIYLHSAILSSDVQNQIEKRVNGIAQKTLNLAEIKQLEIPLPSLDIQSQFADFVRLIENIKKTVHDRINLFNEILDKKMDEYFN